VFAGRISYSRIIYMPERIYKLQPNRSLSLRGFDDLGASAAVHSATANGFKVSGVFRDPADFAVLLLHDADNFYEHPRIKHLPDFDFNGLQLQFDVHYSGLIPLDSPKHASVSWPFLQVILKDGSRQSIRLYDQDPLKSNAVRVAGEQTYASCTFTVEDNGLKEYDRLTLWYQNLAFDYLVPKFEQPYVFTTSGAGTVHTIAVVGEPYRYTEKQGDDQAAIALGIVNALAPCPYVTAARDSVWPAQVNLRAKRDDGIGFDVYSSSTGETKILYGVGVSAVAKDLVQQINGVNWAPTGALIPLRAEAVGAEIRITAQIPGVDGNMLSMYAISKNGQLRTTAGTAVFTGGSSDVTWRVTLDFAALGIPDIRQMWLTFAPALANGSAFQDLEWEATFTNWTLTGSEEARRLKIAAAGSVRVEENDTWCTYQGSWSQEIGFFSGGTARMSSTQGDSVTVKYSCSSVHDLYLGTSLYSDRGTVSVSLDGDSETSLDCALDSDAQVNTRRRVRTGVAPGEHKVTIRLTVAKPFYFDFLEAAVPGDVPDPVPANQHLSPALDYSTDHTYKLPPARIHWIFDQLGYAAPMNEYIGVFWWNQRKRVGAVIPEARIAFEGAFAPGDAVFLKIGELEIGKSVFPADTPETISRHFAQFLNGSSVAVWAKAEANVLTITSRSPKPDYRVPVSIRVDAATGSTGSAALTGSLQSGETGLWMVDPEQSPALNRGAREWHSDMFRECGARGREIVVAASMELVNPPDEFASIFRDGRPVVTDVGFGSLKSTHCAFAAPVLEYQKKVYTALADLMAAAGITPSLQCGEFLWWFFTNRTPENPNGGMAFYHPQINAQAQSELGRPLHGFVAPTDDPEVNNAQDANFLRAKLRDHVNAIVTHVRAAHPNAVFEVLFPYDVNHPKPAGIHNLGGSLNRFVNFPSEWADPATCGFDRLKMEALDFGAWSRNLDLARTAIQFPIEVGWPPSKVRHLIPIFRPGYAWEKELGMALASGIQVVNLWAYDHVCIYGWPVVERSTGKSSFMGA
jgi:hypothetical protein